MSIYIFLATIISTIFIWHLCVFGSLASVHSHVTRVCIVFHAIAYAIFLAQVCKHRLASVLPTLIVLARSITSLSIGVVGNCLIGLLIGFASQPARVPSNSTPIVPTREDTPRPQQVSVAAGEPSASQSQCVEIASEGEEGEGRGGGAYLYNHIVGFAIGVCTCVTLDCTRRGVSREILVASEQPRSLPERFRLIRQLLRP